MNKDNLSQVETPEAFEELLRKHGLFREDDVTMDDLGSENMWVYTGNDFAIDPEFMASLELSEFLIVGDLSVERFDVAAALDDYGVFAVTGNLTCQDLIYATECTALSIAGDLHISRVAYLNCGNSVLQVNGNLTVGLFYDDQCSIDVRGEEKSKLDRNSSVDDIAAHLGVEAGGRSADDIIREFFG
ncbi:MAG: hypothetical protein AAF938_00470 [Myxococcota bacterium]